MPRGTEQLDFNDPSDEQLQGLADGTSDTSSVIQVNELRTEILQKIAGAEGEGVISRTDAIGLKDKLDHTKREKSAVSKLGEEVSQVIQESKMMIQEFTGEKADKKEATFFKELSIDEKRSYLAQLKEKARSLQKRIEGLEKFMPDTDKRLSELTGVERASYIEELNDRRDNTYQFAGLLDINRSFFGQGEVDNLLGGFKDLSVDQQRDWLKDFADKQLKPREDLNKRFEALPKDYRERIGGFKDLSIKEKEQVLEKADQELEFNEMVDGSPESVNISTESRKYAKESFRIAPPALRKEMKGMILKHFAVEQNLFKQFEKQPEEAKKRYPGFVEMPFEKKQSIVSSLEKHDDNLRQYEAMLSDAVRDKVLSEATRDKYVAWFKEQSLKDKQVALSAFENEMKPRKELLSRFEKELPDKVKKENKRFYDLGHQDRMELLEKLLAENAKETNNDKAVDPNLKEEKKESAELTAEQLQDMAARAMSLHQKGKVEQARAMYQTILIYDPNNEQAKGYLAAKTEEPIKEEVHTGELSDSDIAEAIKDIKTDGAMQKKRKLVVIAGGLAGLVKNSDLASQGRIRSSDKDVHLDTKEKSLNDRLLRYTEGKVMAGHGTEKAKKIKRVDFNTLQSMDDAVVTGLKNEVLSHQGEKANTAHHIQLEDKKTSREIAGASGVSWAKKAESAMRAEMLSKVQQRLEKGGRKLDDGELARLKAQIEKEDLSVDLREAA